MRGVRVVELRQATPWSRHGHDMYLVLKDLSQNAKVCILVSLKGSG